MSRFIFFTKTNWVEIPRLRHQLANLLLDNGHEVVFFERPSFVLKHQAETNSSEANILFCRSRQLIHHKLRLHPALHYLNSIYEKKSIESFRRAVNFLPDDIIVNFNYDYFFIKDLFPRNKLITVINDDFWCRALLGYTTPLRWVLKETCQTSDVVLTVSIPLKNQLSEFCAAELFYPWAAQPYIKPAVSLQRKNLLFWGFINKRLNIDYIFQLAEALIIENSNIKLLFIGPVQKSDKLPLKRLMSYENIEITGPQGIEDLNFDEVLAAFIPYVPGNKADDVTTIPNKTFPMLANGLPLVITGMPDFIDEPFVFRLGNDLVADLKLLSELENKFIPLQSSIKEFVRSNTAKHRLEQFMSYL